MSLIKAANLALRFTLELCALAALGYWGYSVGESPITKVGLAIGAPLLAALVWGTFVAPGAAMRASGALYLAMEFAILWGAAAALYASGRGTLACILAVAILANRILMQIWGQ
ncbi:YrdB family protein [Oscillochloris sp. ZM17-4]|uniref:YrdB family protein n=1 Tax=Oscillochloris sp. ZM17-4 TaxID=2866714 RepID=UPI001C738441|nr:YrdB family protein [Oscillochloris sp. ZM17-4]MBX0331110.1 YrdB family protein [Oscillochloris sp. ZM17-4]